VISWSAAAIVVFLNAVSFGEELVDLVVSLAECAVTLEVVSRAVNELFTSTYRLHTMLRSLQR
jgi:hypothetical protein